MSLAQPHDTTLSKPHYDFTAATYLAKSAAPGHLASSNATSNPSGTADRIC